MMEMVTESGTSRVSVGKKRNTSITSYGPIRLEITLSELDRIQLKVTHNDLTTYEVQNIRHISI